MSDSKFTLSPLVASLLVPGALPGIIQACEANIGRRIETGRESTGTKNSKKTGQATSGDIVNYTQQADVVTAFREYAESETGAIDRAVAKMAKLGLVAKLDSIPATFKNQDIGNWFNKMNVAPVVETGKGKGKGKAPKDGAPATVAPVEKPAAPVVA